MFNRPFFTIANQIMEDPDFAITTEQARQWVDLTLDQTMELLTCANLIRQRYKGNQVFTCSITNAKSGKCSQDCAFCAQSVHHQTDINTYDLLSEDTFVNQALSYEDQGATQYSMVTSGESLTDSEIDIICRAASRIKERTRMTLCASLGFLDEKKAGRLFQSGIHRYHHNLETARSFFEKVCTTHDYEDDIDTIRVAKKAGMHICSGGIFGLGETWAQRVEMGFTLKALDVQSVPLNFLNPIKGTPLQDRKPLSPMEALKSIALVRFILPQKDITICGGRELTLQDFQSWVFLAGANGLMIGNYLTTQGRNIETDINMINQMGFSYEPAP